MESNSPEAAADSTGGRRKTPDPFVLVIFGASGDLTARKLIPAVFALHCQGLLPEGAAVLGFARSDMTDESFRDQLWRTTSASLACEGQPADERMWERFASRLYYLCGRYDNPADFHTLRKRIEDLTANNNVPANCLYYLATPPSLFVPIVDQLRHAGLAMKGSAGAPWSRIIVEKPFGCDLQSALALNEQITTAFDEDQIFRIDHYLGKETVQNIMVLRFANSIFEPVWNNKYVDHVQISASEALGVGRRGGYYDQTGAIRDMLQNHMMHLLALVAMEPPVSLAADAIRNEKVQVLQSLRPISPLCAAKDVVRGQYVEGVVDGQEVPPYRREPGVAAESVTETFAALKVHIDNWRWAGVPFYLRTGKRLAERRTEISVHFKSVPNVLFNVPPTGPLGPNVLVICVQPDESIWLQFQVKQPGLGMNIRPLRMDFGYAESFGSAPPEAYQRLLLDAAVGSATLFTRIDEVEAAWRFVTPIISGCARQDAGLLAWYPAGTPGPKAADELIAADGRAWHLR